MSTTDDVERVVDAAGLAALLERDGVAVQRLADGRTLEVPNRIDGVPAPLVILWDAPSGCVQIVQTIPPLVEAARFAAAAVEMARVNHGMLLPGFGMNPATGVAYFRHVLLLSGDLPGRWLTVPELRRGVSVATSLAREFGPRVAAAWRAAPPGDPWMGGAPQ